ncbi:hypothetical protein B296_00058401 [Ensete ventricosum]|uniref:EF-hand domain-containing protein n=1 Tax=Ensete ventricosum TaxID=4639 RepID=A0A426X172_ENSVE|nr:hypothetical protein B296_00058401 [Ensete ventricosum]
MILCLNLQYALSKKPKLKLDKRGSTRDRQVSGLGLMRRYEPDEDEMKQVFDKMSNNKAKIEFEDLKALLQRLKVHDAAREAKQIVQTVGSSKDGSVDFGDFMAVHRKGGVWTSDVVSAFKMFDQDGDGQISAKEIKDMMGRLGEDCSLEECRRMVKEVDKNGDGLVGMDDFMAMMTRTMKLSRLPSSSSSSSSAVPLR